MRRRCVYTHRAFWNAVTVAEFFKLAAVLLSGPIVIAFKRRYEGAVMQSQEELWLYWVAPVVVAGILFILNFSSSLRNLNRAPRPLSKRSKHKMFVFLAQHRLHVEGPPRITLVPLHDPIFCAGIKDVFNDAYWVVLPYPEDIVVKYARGVRVYGTNRTNKGIVVEMFAEIGLKAELDESNPAWHTLIVTFGR